MRLPIFVRLMISCASQYYVTCGGDPAKPGVPGLDQLNALLLATYGENLDTHTPPAARPKSARRPKSTTTATGSNAASADEAAAKSATPPGASTTEVDSEASAAASSAEAGDRGGPTKIAYGEWQATRFEFEDLIARGRVDVLQPDVGRVGGLTEARRVCRLAAREGGGGSRDVEHPGIRG